jgi:hypothetical protein
MSAEMDSAAVKVSAKMSDERKARILEQFLSKIILMANVAEIIRYLRGNSYDIDIFDQGGNITIEDFLADAFESIGDEDARSLFREYLPVFLANELMAKSVSIEWD